MMRILVAAVIVLSCGLCCAEDIPEGNIRRCFVSNEKVLAAEQAAKLVTDFEGDRLA